MESIVRRLGITTVLVDDDERLRRVLRVRAGLDRPLTILATGAGDPEEAGVERFDSFIARNRERARTDAAALPPARVPAYHVV